MLAVGELVQPLEKILGDVCEDDMLGLHQYKGGYHLCLLKVVLTGLTLETLLTLHCHVSFPERVQTDWQQGHWVLRLIEALSHVLFCAHCISTCGFAQVCKWALQYG